MFLSAFLSHLLSSGKRLVRCLFAAALAYQFMTNTAMAESSRPWSEHNHSSRTNHSRLDTPLREKMAPGVVSSNSRLADSTLVGHKGEASRLADNNLAASAATERGIEAAEVAEASSNGSGGQHSHYNCRISRLARIRHPERAAKRRSHASQHTESVFASKRINTAHGTGA